MKLAPSFQFSQSSLQDYRDCPRRFELRYVQNIKWPAPISEPVIEYEHHMQQGILFHQMVQQYLAGIPLENIKAAAADLDLQTWWAHFIQFNPLKKYSGEMYPEYRLSIPLLNYRLVAQYDLLIKRADGGFTIFDWKTSRRYPQKRAVQQKTQSLVYPFVLVEAGFQSKPISPEVVEMIYWYPNFPDQPDTLTYDRSQHQLHKDRLQASVSEILNTPAGQFTLTPDNKHCLFCNYRSLCNRGEKAGQLDQWEEDGLNAQNDLEVDFNNAPEIQF